MKSIVSLSILALIFLITSCECVNDVETDKENIPNQNTGLYVINLLDKFPTLSTYCNDLFIEDVSFKVFNNSPKKYMSGNFVLNFREDKDVVYVASLNLLDSMNYFSFIYENNNQTRFIIKPTLKSNIRVWNLSNSPLDLTIFNNNLLFNSVLANNSVEEFSVNSFPVQFTLNLNGLNISQNISLNNISEIVVYKNQVMKLEYD